VIRLLFQHGPLKDTALHLDMVVPPHTVDVVDIMDAPQGVYLRTIVRDRTDREAWVYRWNIPVRLDHPTHGSRVA
jgi:hypothetical protein